ncbi:MAG: exodeoxyribonuclease III [Deltaproteobacteria bacterium]|nr:exodeoxyribonuclease III [Deltaproteobacteria bacterium]
MKLITWNVNSLRVRLPHLLQLLAEEAPDVVCLQETKVQDGDFPGAALSEAGWPHQLIHGQKTYNGVAILSRHPLTAPVRGFTLGAPDPQTRLVRASVQGVRVVNAYVPMGESIRSDKFAYKLDWLRRLAAELRTEEGEVLLCGDMNVALSDADVFDPFEAEGAVLYSRAEREALGESLATGLTDAYRALYPGGHDFTHWDYRARAFQRNLGYRIDHTLLSEGLMARCAGVEVLKRVRAWEKPSDHAPVMVTLSAG